MKIGRIGLALAALLSIATVAGPTAADRRHRHDDGGFFSFGIGSTGYYYKPPELLLQFPELLCCSELLRACAAGLLPPQPSHYEPGPSFNFSSGTRY